MDYCTFIPLYSIRDKKIRTLIFLWLHSQAFYINLQKKAVEPIDSTATNKLWADIGCSTGLLTRLASKLNYTVTGYDINYISIFFAKLLSWRLKNINYKKKDFHTLTEKFDILSATSLLSVVSNKIESLSKLISLLKDDDSVLIIIEPTEKLSLKNTWELITNLQSFWFYKGLLLWAIARENKHVNNEIFHNIKNINITQKICLNGMVCISYIKLDNKTIQ